MPRIFHNPAVQADAAPNANSEVDTASPKIAESVSTSIVQVFTKLFATVVCEQAWQYMNSYPGHDAWRSNSSYHRRFGRLSQGIIDYGDSVEEDSKVLCYQLSMINLVTELKDYMGLPMVDAHLFDVCTWMERLLEGCRHNPVGLSYSKPTEYLAIAFFESGRSTEQISYDIEKLIFLSIKNGQRLAGVSESE